MSVEYLDVLDENGNLTGTSLPRNTIHKEGLWHRVVHVWIINNKQEVLIQKRTETKDSWPGLWDISSAGHISAGDDSLTTALKELEEELGIHLQKEQLELIFREKNEVVLNEGLTKKKNK